MDSLHCCRVLVCLVHVSSVERALGPFYFIYFIYCIIKIRWCKFDLFPSRTSIIFLFLTLLFVTFSQHPSFLPFPQCARASVCQAASHPTALCIFFTTPTPHRNYAKRKHLTTTTFKRSSFDSGKNGGQINAFSFLEEKA